jgi:hypothetical protein
MVQALQLASGLLWLLPALFLSPRIVRSWRPGASRATMLSTPIAFLSWLMVGFIARWLVWPRSIDGMLPTEVVCWCALYIMSGGCALWVLLGAFQTRGE